MSADRDAGGGERVLCVEGGDGTVEEGVVGGFRVYLTSDRVNIEY